MELKLTKGTNPRSLVQVGSLIEMNEHEDSGADDTTWRAHMCF